MRCSRRDACALALLGGLGVSCVGSIPITGAGTGGTTQTGMGVGGARSPDNGVGGAASGVGGRGVGGSGMGGAAQLDGGSRDAPADTATGTGGRSPSDAGGSAGATGAAGAGGVSQCTPGRYAICESFENAAVGANVAPAGWTRSGGVDVIADPANVFRGSHAMRLNPVLNGARRINMTGAAVTGLGGAFWGRIFYKVQTPAPVSCDTCCGNVLHTTLVGMDGVGPTGGAGEYRFVDTVENLQGMHQFLWNIQYNSGTEVGRGSAYNYKYDGAWHCAEWHIDNTTSAFQFFLDGSAITLSGTAGDFPTSYSAIHVGLNNYQMACAPYMTAFIDEIAVDKSRIGCGG
jgi:hypothetical protein